MDKLVDLLNQISDVELEIAEMEESGELENIVAAHFILEDLWAQHLKTKMEETGG